MNQNCPRPALKIRLFLITILFFFSIHSIAQSNNTDGIIKGKVTTSDNEPAVNVTVKLKNKPRTVLTTEDGSFTIRNLAAGDYELEISLVGYQTTTERVSVRSKETSTVTIQLQVTGKQLQEVVISASSGSYKSDQPSSSLRIQTSLMETPQAIISVNRNLLDDQQIFTVTDVSKNVSGVTSIFPYVGVYTDFNIRGTRTTSNKLRNGMSTNASGVLQEDLSYVENIEFIKGPAGFMLAQGEPGGMYNVVTKKPLRKTHAAFNITTGSYGLYRSAIDLGSTAGKEKKLSYRLNIMGQKSGTNLDHGINNRISVAPVIRYDFNKATSLTFEYNFDKAAVNGTFAQVPTRNGKFLRRSFSVEDPSAEPLRFTNHYGYLNLQHQLNENWKLTVQAGIQYALQKGSLFYTTAPISESNLLQRNYRYLGRKSTATTAQVFLNGNLRTGSITHKILAGADGGMVDSKQIFANINNVLPINVVKPVYGLAAGIDTLMNESALLWQSPVRIVWQAITIQDDIRFTPWLQLTIGGRYTYYENTSSGAPMKDNVVTPRAGLVLQPLENLSIYALYDRAFVAQTGTNAAGDRFDPLKGENLEFGIKKEWFGKRLLTQVAVYNITKNNALTSDINNPGFSVQTGEIKSKGIELDLMGSIGKNWNIVANYAYTDAKITKDNNPNLEGTKQQAPLHTTNAWIKYTITDGLLKDLGVGIGGSYYSNQYTFTTRKAASDPQAKLPDYKSLNASLSYKTGNLLFALNIDNLTNEFNIIGNYNYTLGARGEYLYIALPGTNWRFSATYKL
jgi:iron complex outermembrane receptor protein